MNAKFRRLIFSSQNDERKFRVLCFLSSFESFSRFSFEECESAFSSYYTNITQLYKKHYSRVYSNNTNSL